MNDIRPDILSGQTVVVKVGCGELLIVFNHKDDARYKEPPLNELFIKTKFISKDSEDIMAICCENFIQPLARLLTWIIRRIPEKERGQLIKQLVINDKAGCPKQSVVTNKSCIDAVGRALMCYWDGHKIKDGRCYICKKSE